MTFKLTNLLKLSGTTNTCSTRKSVQHALKLHEKNIGFCCRERRKILDFVAEKEEKRRLRKNGGKR